jgi:hypothetical protein
MQSILRMLSDKHIDTYTDDFEHGFLLQTTSFYKTAAAQFMETHSCPEYLTQVDAWLAAEMQRADAYLSVATKPRLLQACVDKLVVAYAPRLVADTATGCAAMLDSSAQNDLDRMYALFTRGDGRALKCMVDATTAHVKARGKGVVEDEGNGT